MTDTLPLSLDAAHLAPDIVPAQVAAWSHRLSAAHEMLTTGTGAGADFRGWLDPAAIVTEEQITEIEAIAADLRAKSDTLVVVGIGGSYLGSRAVIEALAAPDAPTVHFAGNSLSAQYHSRLIETVKNQRVAVNVVSKSGTTTEPAVAFRLLRNLVEQQAGKDGAKDLIVATTDEKKGALRKVAVEVGYRTLPIADDIGGRYSVLSPVGLLPIAYAGIDIRALLKGASDCARAAEETDPLKNPILFYAAARNLLYNQGYSIEVFASFEPRLHYLAEWWKQLFGESEGKDQMALFPASVDLTADLHSMGQYLQQGRRQMIETFVILDSASEPDLPIPPGDDADELGYLTGRPIAEINHAAYQATSLAHRDGGVPNMTLTLSALNAHSLGFLLYFFERACGVSGYLLGVNPFDQPGVEAYKKNMFALLAKPGYESETKRLQDAVGKGAADSSVSFG
ncbi:MAG: glucose-6-phosphate isomerase [Armatimonadota bacterium]